MAMILSRLKCVNKMTIFSHHDERGLCVHWPCGRNLPQTFRQWASYQIRKIAGCACAGNAGNIFPRRRFQSKSLVNDSDMHHGTCVTHVPWCMSGSLTRSDGENVPGIPSACAPAILRIWQEAHGEMNAVFSYAYYIPRLGSEVVYKFYLVRLSVCPSVDRIVSALYLT